MAEALGPYSKNAINWTNSDASKKRDVTFWGFDEGKVLGDEDQQHKWRDSDNIRFPMSQKLYDCILETFHSLSKHPEGGDLYLKRGWPEKRGTSADSQNMSDYIEFYADIFADCELIPYIYPLQIGREGPISGNYCNQQKGVASSTANSKSSPLNGLVGYVNTWLNTEIIDPSDGNAMEIEYTSTYSEQSTDADEKSKCGYTMLDLNSDDFVRNQRLMNVEDTSKMTSLVTMPKLINRGGANQSNARGALIATEEDLYSNTNRVATAYNTTAQKWNICDVMVDPATSGYIADPKLLCSGVFTFNNENDTSITSSNARQTIMQRYAGAYNSTTLSTLNPGQNEYFFFVKTKKPWYTWETGNIDEDFPKENDSQYQYWAFNINSLFHASPNTSGYPCFYNAKWSTGSGQNLYRATYWPTVGNETYPYVISAGYTGLNMCSNTKYVSGWGNYTFIPYYFYVPFAYYLVHGVNKLDCFEGADILNPGIAAAEVNAPRFDNSTTADSNPTRFGLCINAKKSQWEDFFKNHLGLYQTTTDPKEALYKPTAQWATVPVVPVDQVQPEPPGPSDYQPGSGGQSGVTPAGGTGDYGTNNDPVIPNTTSTGGGRINRAWNMNQPAVIALQECLVNDNLWDSLKTIFKSNYQEGMINLIQFPFDVTQLYSEGTLQTVKVLGVDMDFSGISNFCDGYEIPRNITTTVLFGSFDIKERFGSFNDYRNTIIDLYVPFCGHINLQPSHVMGRRIKIYLDIDFGDGSCLSTIWSSHVRNDWANIESGGFFPVGSINGQIGTPVPLASSDGLIKTQQKAFAGIGTILGAGATIATGGAAAIPMAAGAVGGGIGSQISMAVNNKPDYQAGGVVNSQHTLAVTTDCVLTITYPEIDMPPDYAEIAGYPTQLNTTLSTCSGFTAADMVKLNGLACTDAEADEIKNLLSQGVVIK